MRCELLTGKGTAGYTQKGDKRGKSGGRNVGQRTVPCPMFVFLGEAKKMVVKLQFDMQQHFVFIPDGYVIDINQIRSDFFEWIEERPEYWTMSKHGGFALSYDGTAFLCFINEVVLLGKEKAFFIDKPIRRKKIPIIHF